MDRETETRCLRDFQEGDQVFLRRHLSGGPQASIEGQLLYRFEVHYGQQKGELSFDVDRESGEILHAMMDVGFKRPLGLNQSPLELRILCEHIRDQWPES